MDRQNAHIPTVFALLRACLWGHDFSPTPDTDWNAVWLELRQHTVHNLSVDVLTKADPAGHGRYLRSSVMACTAWYKLMGVQQEITRALTEAGIRCATIKGAAADIDYPQPVYRTMGDIDLLIDPPELERAAKLLVELGCTVHDTRNPRHIELRKDGIQIELHRHFAVLSDHGRAARVDNMLFDALERAEKKQIEGYAFYMLPETENGMVLIEHINSHMASGLGLRQIIDWMLYVDKHLGDDAWFGGFREAVQRVGLEKLTVTVTRMCQLYLGLRRNITWCQTADEKLCHRLMEHTMGQGNFGRKQDRRTNGTVQVLNALDGDLSFFQLLQRHGCYNWKALKTHPWLRPFAWLYQLCRYIRKAFKGKNPFATFFRAAGRQKKNADLLAQLDVQRKDHMLEYDD